MHEKQEEHRKDWNYAIGMSKIDGGEPSPGLLALIEQEINGEITMDDILKELNKMYRESNTVQIPSEKDPYMQQNGVTMMNKFGITDPGKLKQAEFDFSSVRIKELRDKPIQSE